MANTQNSVMQMLITYSSVKDSLWSDIPVQRLETAFGIIFSAVYTFTNMCFKNVMWQDLKHTIIYAVLRMQVCMLLSCIAAVVVIATFKVTFAMHG